jgi:filamentous hemagglutinin family protein
MKPRILLAFLIIPLSIKAQMTTDGTLGPDIKLSGPDYQIPAEVGQQRGSNLFHSFQDFNLNSAESATFSGPTHIQNVISRVTGGNPSNIDGLIRTTIPNTDMYFLNPYGIFFGPNARLDVPGSFHASTADYLRLQDGGRFDARHPNESLLTIAPVEAFGFLSPNMKNENGIAPISIQGHGEVTQNWKNQTTGLNVPPGKILSLIGGHIQIKNGTFFKTIIIDDQGNEIQQTHQLPTISAPYGKIQLASVASEGEIRLESDFMDVSSFTQLANIQISEHTLVQVSGEGGGSIFIRSDQFVVDNSILEANTLGSKNGGLIDIQANQISFNNGTEIQGNTEGIGRGTDINIQANAITIAGENQDLVRTAIYARSGISQQLTDNNLGDAGQISLKANQILIKDGALISGSTYGGGQGASIILNAKESVILKGEGYENDTVIAAATYGKNKPGNAGDVLIEANQIQFMDGSYITSVTTGTGHGGEIILRASESVTFSGEDSEGNMTRIRLTTSYKEPNAGDAGTLLIEAPNIFITDGAYLTSRTTGKGDGGEITLLAKEAIIFKGIGSRGNGSDIFALTRHEGDGGTISINTNLLLLSEDSSFRADSLGKMSQAGKAGDITIQTNRLFLTDSRISTATTNASGGHLTIRIQNLLYLRDSQMTTSVKGGTGDGGNLSTSQPMFVIMDDGKIIAQAYQGNGGNIRITSDQFIASPDSLVSASSKLGLDGNVEINSPDKNVSEGILTLSFSRQEADKLMKIPCEAMSYEEYVNRSRFVVVPLAGSSPSPFDLQPSRLSAHSLEKILKTARKSTTRTKGPAKVAKPQEPVALWIVCRSSQTQSENGVMPEQLF